MQQFTDQRLLLDEVRNHAEFRDKLTKLKLTSDLGTLDSAVSDVIRSWFELAGQHANELAKLDPKAMPRAVYSRAYYAAYNASKAVRYASFGTVSLKGDDHRKVSELPDSFPDVEAWSRDLQVLYQHRLRADYDNWTHTAVEHSLKPEECADLAQRFLAVSSTFLHDVYGVNV